jgi:hypothetical protein
MKPLDLVESKPALRRNVSPPFSGPKGKLTKDHHEVGSELADFLLCLLYILRWRRYAPP